MTSGVYIGKTDTGSYDLVSTGDYINPITATFKLTDSGNSLIQSIPLFVMVSDIEVDTIKIQVIGAVTAIRQFVSWDGITWSTSISYNNTVSSIGQITTIPFYTRIIVDDFLEYFNITQASSYNQYKLKLIYA